MSITISAEKRVVIGRDNWKTRAEGFVPAVVYGPAMEPKNVSVDRKALVLAFREAGESTLVDLVVNGDQAVKVLIQDLQFDPMSSEIIHADFRAVDLTKEITAKIKLEFIGESAAVKELGGTLVQALNEIEVRALPQNLVHLIEVDISKLKTFDDTIHISDLTFPTGVAAVDDLGDTVALVTPPRSEEEMAELDKALDIDVNAVEVAKKEKKEGEAEAGTDEKKTDDKKKPDDKKKSDKK